ncbi:hypothetical protein DPMN_113115 [Dreissena polymorpha]|uniref:Uncharacterized protein n=1 Tax=Dreissena polymorpha TaxID=45954 RepID=A0A9D4KI62_DREPO|nr:hypothetical protein DPMN_113115 [Dreissena polymorpha]
MQEDPGREEFLLRVPGPLPKTGNFKLGNNCGTTSINKIRLIPILVSLQLRLDFNV